MFNLKELRLMKKGLETVALNVATGHSIEDVIPINIFLQTLLDYLDREYPGEVTLT
jgi:hypothetical protein